MKSGATVCKHTFTAMGTIEQKKDAELPSCSFRFIDRDRLRGRSTGTKIYSFESLLGRFNILRVGENSSYIYLEDWFHTISSLSTGKVILLIVSLVCICVSFKHSMVFQFWHGLLFFIYFEIMDLLTYPPLSLL